MSQSLLPHCLKFRAGPIIILFAQRPFDQDDHNEMKMDRSQELELENTSAKGGQS